MPWYWTDDLARTLIDAGKVSPSRVMQWMSAPVAIRGDDDAQTVADSLLSEEEGEPPALPVAA